MRILHVISTLAPESGGPTRVIQGLATAQAEAGHDVTVCVSDRGNPTNKRLSGEYFNEFYSDKIILKVFPVLLHKILFSPWMALWLRRAIRSFDVVHIHGLYRFPPTYAAYEARRQGVPYIIRPHGSLDPYLYKTSSYSVPLKKLYEKIFDMPNLHNASGIHYTASDECHRTDFLKLKAPPFVVPNGLTWSQYEVLPQPGRLRAKWGVNDRLLVLFLGRLHFKKGLDLLVPAIDRLKFKYPKMVLILAGPENDDYGEQVRSWVRERNLINRVIFVGQLTGEDVIQAYVDADVFALPSYTENFGMTVIEAMASGLPVLISNQVNIHDDVAEAGAGIVVPCEIDEVANGLSLLLEKSEWRHVMGQAGRRLVAKRYSWRGIVDQLTLQYERAMARSRRK